MAGNNHGHTPAAWTGTTICLIGFCVAGWFTVVAQPWGVVAGVVMACLGGVVGMVMRSAGMGQPKREEDLTRQVREIAESRRLAAGSGREHEHEREPQTQAS